MRTTDQAALQHRHARLPYVEDTVERGQPVGGRRPHPDDVDVAVSRDLRDLRLADSRVALREEPRLGAVHPVDEPRETTELLFDEGAQRLVELDVLGPDGDVHPYLLVLVRS